jgi:hypothetical protein
MSFSSSTSSLSSTTNNGETEDDGKIRAVSNGGVTGITGRPATVTATTIQPSATTTTTPAPATTTHATAAAIINSKSGTSASLSVVHNSSCSCSSSLASMNHVPESAARWIVTQLVKYAQSMSGQNSTVSLETVFVHHAGICPPRVTTTQESAKLFIEAIIHRFSRQTIEHQEGLAYLKCKSILH